MASDDGARPLGFSALVEEGDAEPASPKKTSPGPDGQPEELQLLERSGSTRTGLTEDEKVLLLS